MNFPPPETGNSQIVPPEAPDQRQRRLKRRRRIGYIAALASSLAVGIGACGHEAQTSSAPTKPQTDTAPPARTVTHKSSPATHKKKPAPRPKPAEPMCNVLVLSVELGPGRGAAGSTYAPLEFTNIGRTACWFYGYPGVGAWSGRHMIGEAASRDHSVVPERVSLRPGDTAHARLRISEAANYPPQECKPEEAEGLMVFPPGSYGAKVAPDKFTACAGGVALLHVRPVIK